MTHVFEKLFEDEYQYVDRHKVLNEPVFRSPRPLHAFTVATHVPLVNLSTEDERFTTVTRYLKYWLTSKSEYAPRAPYELQLNKQENDKGLNLPRLLSVDNVRDQAIRTAVAQRGKSLTTDELLSFRSACPEIDKIFIRVVEHQPEYLIFGCYSQIIQVIHNVFSDKIRSDYRQIADVCNNLIALLHKTLEEHSQDVRKILSLLVERSSEATRFISHLHLGGLISNFRQHNAAYTQPTPWVENPELTTFDGDHCQFDLLPLLPLGSKYSVRWYRSNQFWNYTFFEACAETVVPGQAAGGNLSKGVSQAGDLPSFALGEQHENTLDAHSNWLPQFIQLLLTQGAAPSVLEATPLYDLFESVQDSHFPGKTISGAHYCFIPAGIMVMLLYFPSAARELSNRIVNPRVGVDLSVLDAVVVQLNTFIRAPVYKEFVELLSVLRAQYPEHLDEATTTAFSQALSNPGKVALPSIRKLLLLGWLFWRWMEDNDENREARAQQIGRIMAKFSIDLWDALNASTPRTFSRESDFIACFTVDKRSIYFTNFQPMGTDRFTRTFFIDFALTGFQRGRLAERLCDIATYRTMALRDINRIRAMVRGMDEIGQDLNTLEGQPPIDTGRPLENMLQQLDRKIGQLGEIQQRLDEMNLFVTYGVRGRFLSVSGFYEQIKERSVDIRQMRIFGFPMLSDFLDRRVAHGVRDVERMAERYDYLRGKVQDYYDRVRTQYIQIETSRIARFGEKANELNDQMIKANRETRQTLKMTELLSLLLAVSALVVWIKDLPLYGQYVSGFEGYLAGFAISVLGIVFLYLTLRSVFTFLESPVYHKIKRALGMDDGSSSDDT